MHIDMANNFVLNVNCGGKVQNYELNYRIKTAKNLTIIIIFELYSSIFNFNFKNLNSNVCFN